MPAPAAAEAGAADPAAVKLGTLTPAELEPAVLGGAVIAAELPDEDVEMPEPGLDEDAELQALNARTAIQVMAVATFVLGVVMVRVLPEGGRCDREILTPPDGTA